MLWIQEGANLYAGDDTPNNNKWQNLESVALPTMEEMSESHQGGGSFMEVEYGRMGVKALTPSFKLKGWDVQVSRLFGAETRTPWTVYGMLRDRQTDRPIEVKAVIFARLSKYGPDEFQKGKMMGHDCGMVEVVHYALTIDGNEEIYVDANEPAYRVGGVDRLANERRILRLPGS